MRLVVILWLVFAACACGDWSDIQPGRRVEATAQQAAVVEMTEVEYQAWKGMPASKVVTVAAVPVAAAPVVYVSSPRSVATTAQFPGAIPFHAGHTCPQCGRSQFAISGYLPNGQHVHTCAMGHSWRH